MGAPMDPEEVLKIFYQATRAVGHMHAQSSPVIHRDIKVSLVCATINISLSLRFCF